MKRTLMTTLVAAPLALSLLATPVTAKRHRKHVTPRHQVAARDDHGNCLRFNKTTGAVAGAVAGGLLGRAIDGGGSTGTIIGAAGGGLAGHSLARDGRKRC